LCVLKHLASGRFSFSLNAKAERTQKNTGYIPEKADSDYSTGLEAGKPKRRTER